MIDVRYTAPKCKFTVDNGHIVTDGSVKNKITGTSMAGILGVSPFTTPFQIACALLGLGREDISRKPEVLVGQALEGEIIRYAGTVYSKYGLFETADEIFEKREGDHDSWESDFADDVFAGHVDGIVMDKNNGNYILEVKTSKNYDSWANGVPEYYYWQIALYNEFVPNTQKDKAYVLLGLTSEATMRDINSWVANEKTVTMFEMPIDREEVQKKIEEVREWYAKYILNGITPDHDPTNPKDVALYDHLVNITADVGDISELVDQLAAIDERILSYEKEEKGLYDFRDTLKARIRDYQITHHISEVWSTSEVYVSKLSTRVTEKWDETKMFLDGIDASKYKIITKTEFVSIKKRPKR